MGQPGQLGFFLAYIIKAAPPGIFEMFSLLACLNTASGSSSYLRFQSLVSMLPGGLPLSPSEPNHGQELDDLAASLEDVW